LYVPAPELTPYSYGLFSAALMPPEEADPHWACGVQYEPYACDKAKGITDDCPPPDPAPEKAADDGVPLVTGSPFVVYDGYLCRLPGRASEAEIMDRARRALLLGEQRAAEEFYWTGSLGNDPHLADPSAVVLNPVNPPTAADALSPIAGLAALENYLATNYGGVGVIHMPRGLAVLLSRDQVLYRDRTRLLTFLGTPVAAGGGYVVNTGPDGSPAPDGTAWMYATGRVVIRRSDVVINPDSLAQAFNRSTNEVHILAERTYVITHECVLAAVLVTINC
jgi:hypothetical protein